ncbi:MAG: hypothetical protein ABIJ09_22905 [Pseudomonadota bacterium]
MPLSLSRLHPKGQRTRTLLGVGLGLLLNLPGLVLADEGTNCGLGADVLPAAHCSAVFGEEHDRGVNRTYRRQVIEGIEVGEYCIDLLHSTDWYQPAPILYRSLSLLETRVDGACPAVALVQLDSDVVDVDCPSGVYALHVDDDLGASARILAILDGVLLIESDDELRYMKTTDVERPVWRLTWQSPWRFKVPKNYGKSGGKPPRKKPPPRKKGKKRR